MSTIARPTYTRTLLAETAAESQSINEMMRRLGVPMAGGTHSYLSKRLKHYGIDTSHFTHMAKTDYGRRCYDRDALAEAAANSTSLRTTMDYLGIEPYNGAYSYLKARLAHFEIDTSHFATAPLTGREQLKRFGKLIPLEVLAPATARALSIKGLLLLLDLNYTGVTRALAKRSLAEHGLDTSHFTGSGHLRGKASATRRPAAEVLRIYPPGSLRVSHKRLARALTDIEREYRCAKCGNEGVWQGRRLLLEIDHISGDWLDNRPENLRYLCPNCHSSTETWCGGNRRGRADKTRANLSG